MKQALGGKSDLFTECEWRCLCVRLMCFQFLWRFFLLQTSVWYFEFKIHRPSSQEEISCSISFSSFLFVFLTFFLHISCTRGPWGTLSTAYCNRLGISNMYWTFVTKRSFSVPVSASCFHRSIKTGLCCSSVKLLIRLWPCLLTGHCSDSWNAECTFSTWPGKRIIKANQIFSDFIPARGRWMIF